MPGAQSTKVVWGTGQEVKRSAASGSARGGVLDADRDRAGVAMSVMSPVTDWRDLDADRDRAGVAMSVMNPVTDFFQTR